MFCKRTLAASPSKILPVTTAGALGAFRVYQPVAVRLEAAAAGHVSRSW
jgi:hypothetical protein